ncbi:MAG: PAS domain S-box protein [Spirochaetia bacterium]|nr:PAS domain S-box protein [Spirochaetia bacterium]
MFQETPPELYQSIIENFRDGFWIADPAGHIVQVNQGYCLLSGYTKSELLTMQIGDLEASESPADTAVHMHKIMSNGHDRFETWHKRKDGRTFLVDATISYVAPHGFICFFRDITERRRSQDELKEQTLLLNESQRIARIASYKTDLITGEWSGSSMLDEILGVPPDFHRTLKSWAELIHPDDAPGVNAYLQNQVLEKGQPFNRRYRIIRPVNQSVRWVHGFGELQRNADGKIIGMIGTLQDVTDLKLTEEALVEREKEFRAMSEQAAVGVVRVDSHTGRFIWANRKFSSMLGYPHEELMKLTFQDVTHPDTRDEDSDRVRRLVRGDFREFTIDKRYVKKDGSVLWGNLSVSALWNPDEPPRHHLAIVQDITERKRAEEALRAASLYARGLLEASLDPLVTISPEGKITDVNQATELVTGLQRDILVGTDFSAYFTDPQKAKAGYQKVLLEGLVRDYPLTIRHQTGKETKVLYNAVSYLNESGTIQGVFAAARDITERERAAEALRENAAQLRRAQEIAHMGSWVWNVKTNTVTWSDEMYRIFGVDKDTFDGDLEAIVKKAIHPEDRKAVEASNESVAKFGKPIPLEYRVVRPDGTIRNVWGEAGDSIHDSDGSILSLSGIVLDITERKREEKDRERLLEQLNQSGKLEGLGTLASGIAHDFNNILSIIMGHTQRLKDQPTISSESAKSIDAIETSALRGTAVVRQLLTLARKDESVSKPVSLNDIASEMRSLLEATFPKTISVTVDLNADLPPVLADASQIHQVLLNLCVNARDAMQQGGRLTIATKKVGRDAVLADFPTANASEYVVMSVTDTGIGMDAETKRRIFEPFFTTKAVNKGTGLGLSLVWSVIQNHRGSIAVDSRPGHGTTFRLYFPVAEQTLEVPRNTEKKKGSPQGSETVLVIEDEPLLSELLGIYLSEAGYSVLSAKDGEEGVATFKEHRHEISLVLCDLGMPKLPGDEVFRQIREIDPNASVIIWSGFIDPHLRARLEAAGVAQIIQKPHVVSEMLGPIRAVLDKKKAKAP